MRDIIDPSRNLGHVDGKKKSNTLGSLDATNSSQSTAEKESGTVDEERSDKRDHDNEKKNKNTSIAGIGLEQLIGQKTRTMLVQGEGKSDKKERTDNGARALGDESTGGDVTRDVDGSVCQDCD